MHLLQYGMSIDATCITAEDACKLLEGGTAFFIDVRTPGEYGRGKIPGSINMPVDELEQHIGQLPQDKGTQIILYCLSGSRSDIAVQFLRGLGYSRSFSMTSGLLAWRAGKYPLAP